MFSSCGWFLVLCRTGDATSYGHDWQSPFWRFREYDSLVLGQKPQHAALYTVKAIFPRTAIMRSWKGRGKQVSQTRLILFPCCCYPPRISSLPRFPYFSHLRQLFVPSSFLSLQPDFVHRPFLADFWSASAEFLSGDQMTKQLWASRVFSI